MVECQASDLEVRDLNPGPVLNFSLETRNLNILCEESPNPRSANSPQMLLNPLTSM